MSKKKTLTESQLLNLLLDHTIEWDAYEKCVKSTYEEHSAEALIKAAKDKLEEQEEHKDDPEPVDLTVRHLHVGRIIYEAVIGGEFLRYDCESKKYSIVRTIKSGNKTYHAESDSPYQQYTILEKKGEQSLSYYFQEIYDLISEFLVADVNTKYLLTSYILLTYQQEKVSAIPYIFITGLPDSGKSRVGEVVARLGYRPLFTGSELNSANVYDYIGTENEGDCTIIEDEAQQLGDDTPEARAKLSIYRTGYRKGSKVRRIIDPSQRSRAARNYKTYGCKLFIGYYTPFDDAFMSRSIVVEYFVAPKDVKYKEKITDEDEGRFLILKSKLLIARMVHFGEKLPDVEIEYRSRAKELWEPLIQVVAGTEFEEGMRKFMKLKNDEAQATLSEGLEAHLVKTVRVLLHDKNRILPFDLIWRALWIMLQDTNGVEKDKHFSQILDREISKKAIGSRLKLFGGQARVGLCRTYQFKLNILQDISDKYFVKEDDITQAYIILKERNPDLF